MVLASHAQFIRDQALERTNVVQLVPNAHQLLDNISPRMVNAETVSHIPDPKQMEFVDQISAD